MGCKSAVGVPLWTHREQGSPASRRQGQDREGFNLAKSKVAPLSECSFLSFTMTGNKIRWTDKSVAAFKHRVKELTGRSWGMSMDHRRCSRRGPMPG